MHHVVNIVTVDRKVIFNWLVLTGPPWFCWLFLTWTTLVQLAVLTGNTLFQLAVPELDQLGQALDDGCRFVCNSLAGSAGFIW